MRSDVSNISSSWYDFLGWLEINKKGLVVGGIVLLLVVFGVIAYRWKLRQTEIHASSALLELRVSPRAAPEEPLAGAEELLRVVAEFPNTSAARRAALLAAGALFREGKYAEAESEFRSVLDDGGAKPLSGTAAFGVAASLEAQGKTAEALAEYEGFSARYPDSVLGQRASLAQARIQEANGEYASALKIYNEVVESAQATASAQARERKQYLLAAHPELAATNAPPSITTDSTPAQTPPKSDTATVPGADAE